MKWDRLRNRPLALTLAGRKLQMVKIWEVTGSSVVSESLETGENYAIYARK